jgi:hypothetical protein
MWSRGRTTHSNSTQNVGAHKPIAKIIAFTLTEHTHYSGVFERTSIRENTRNRTETKFCVKKYIYDNSVTTDHVPYGYDEAHR